jgi:hypothetical protein
MLNSNRIIKLKKKSMIKDEILCHEKKRFQEKKKQSEKHWDSKKKLKEVSKKSN